MDLKKADSCKIRFSMRRIS